MGRPVPRQLLRNAVLDVTTIVPATAYHRRSYAERYSRFIAGDPHMRTLKLHFPDDALPTLDTFIKQTKEARVFRRAQAVRHVVKGQRLQTVSDALSFTYSALRKWVNRFASQGVQGLVDRPRSGRPPKITCELEQHLNRLVDQDPLQHGSLYSQWSCRELATVLARETGVQLGRESIRCALKKRM
jgi:transposase